MTERRPDDQPAPIPQRAPGNDPTKPPEPPKVTPLDEDKKIEDGIEVNET